MLPFRGICLRALRPSILNPRLQSHNMVFVVQTIRQKTTMRKKKKKSGDFVEKDHVRRLRLKRKAEKELDKKRQRLAKEEAARRAQFRLPRHVPRPDAMPFGTAMRLLRGWGAKQDIFVRSTAARWSGDTKVVAMVRVVPNDHNPKPIKGRVTFPFPVVLGKEGKKEKIAAIVEDEEEVEMAKNAGMITGGKEYLDQIVKWVSNGQALPFDVLLATPKTVSMFRQHGRILGPKGLMPNEKRGTIVEDFSTYGTREEKGIELKADAPGKSSRGTMVRVVVGKFKQDDHSIQANLRSLIRRILSATARTQLPLELYLYTTVHPSLIHANPYLTVQGTIHVPRLTADGTLKLQRPNTVYPPERPGYLSTASFMVPIADFPGVGHPRPTLTQGFVKRYAADADWAIAQGRELQLSKYKAGIRELEKKKFVHKWHVNRTEEDRQEERKAGFRRSGEVIEQAKPGRQVL